MNFCVNCVHHIPFDSSRTSSAVHVALCDKAPRNQHDTDYFVTGIEGAQYQFCTWVRGTENMCGRDGKWFEAREPEAA